MCKRFLVLSMLFLLSSFGTMAQTKYIGKVVDGVSAEALSGVVVAEQSEGADRAAVMTDVDGNFSITLQGEGRLSFTYMGYSTRVLPVSPEKRNLGRIELFEDTVSLQAVLVVGSGLHDLVKDRQTPIAVTTLSGAQIEERQGNLDLPETLKGVPSVHAVSHSGYGDGAFTVRGFDQANVLVLVNGQPVNDMEWGGIYWSNWSGLTDVASVVQQQRGLGSSKIGISSVGGTTNIVTRASDLRAGGKLKVLGGNDGYVKTLLSFSSGTQENGWAVSGLLSFWRGDGYVDCTPGLGGTYFLSLGYRPNSRHSFNVTVTGAPQVHEQAYRETIDTYEKYGYRYNSNWGYREGKPYSFSRNFYHKPIANFNWDWRINSAVSLSTVLYGSWGYGGGTGTAGTPHYMLPDDERGLIMVDDVVRANQGEKVDGIKRSVAPWDGTALDSRSKYWNGKNVVTSRGGGTVLRSSMNNHSWYGLLSSVDATLGDHWTLNAGVDMRTYVGSHYRVVNDLLGADAYYDNVNVNSAGVFVSDGVSLNPLAIRAMQSAQKIDRNFESHVGWLGLFGQIEYANEYVSCFVQGSISDQFYRRHEFFELPTSSQWTKWYDRWGGNIKGGVNWKINRMHNVFLNAGYFSRQPFFSSLFPYSYTARANDFVSEIKNEGIWSVEGGYVFNALYMRAELNGYYTVWGDRYQSFTADSKKRTYARTYVDQHHAGAELALLGFPTSWLKLTGMFSYGHRVYRGTADALVVDDTGKPIEGEKLTLFLDKKKIGGAPMLQGSLGARFEIVRGLSLNLDWYANDLLYSNVQASDFRKQDAQALRLPWYNTLDGGVTYSYRFAERFSIRRLTFRANVNNMLNTKYIIQGYSSIQADADDSRNWKGINKKNTVNFGYGTTWNIGVAMSW